MSATIDPASAERVASLITLPDDCDRDDLRVVAAACYLDGVIYTMPPPARHHDVVHEMSGRGLSVMRADCEQGFLLNNGRFAMRKAAAALAVRNGQIDAPKWPPNLYSEDLW